MAWGRGEESVPVNFACQFDWPWGAQIKLYFGYVCEGISRNYLNQQTQ